MEINESKYWDMVAHIAKLTAEIDILQAKIKCCEKDRLMLDALEQAGVDNWSGYGEAMQLYNEWIGA